MAKTGAIAATEPIAVMVEAGKDYWWCVCGKSKNAAVLRRLAQGIGIFAADVDRAGDPADLVLRLQADRDAAALQRHAQDAGADVN